MNAVQGSCECCIRRGSCNRWAGSAATREEVSVVDSSPLSLTGMEAAQMAPSLRWIGLAALGIALTGCVSQDQYSALKLERDRIAEQLVQSQREASTSASA